MASINQRCSLEMLISLIASRILRRAVGYRYRTILTRAMAALIHFIRRFIWPTTFANASVWGPIALERSVSCRRTKRCHVYRSAGRHRTDPGGAGVLVADATSNPTRRYGFRVKCAGNLRQIGRRLLMYSNDNKGHYPQAIYAGEASVIPTWGTGGRDESLG